jgi:hypothetical protein
MPSIQACYENETRKLWVAVKAPSETVTTIRSVPTKPPLVTVSTLPLRPAVTVAGAPGAAAPVSRA